MKIINNTVNFLFLAPQESILIVLCSITTFLKAQYTHHVESQLVPCNRLVDCNRDSSASIFRRKKRIQTHKLLKKTNWLKYCSILWCDSRHRSTSVMLSTKVFFFFWCYRKWRYQHCDKSQQFHFISWMSFGLMKFRNVALLSGQIIFVLFSVLTAAIFEICNRQQARKSCTKHIKLWKPMKNRKK